MKQEWCDRAMGSDALKAKVADNVLGDCVFVGENNRPAGAR